MLSRIVYNEQISQMYGVYGEYESSFDPFPSRLSIYIAQIVPLEIAFSFENYRFNGFTFVFYSESHTADHQVMNALSGLQHRIFRNYPTENLCCLLIVIKDGVKLIFGLAIRVSKFFNIQGSLMPG